jgi:nitrogen fixation-related uncharacterized protein
MKKRINQSRHRTAARIVLVVGAMGVALAPSRAWAHDNLGGDELAVANWMLVGALVTVVLGVLWGVWALKTGQFNNVEASKYTMLENAEDYDAIMAEYDARQNAAQQPSSAMLAGAQTAPGVSVQTDPALARKATGGKTASA